MSRKFSDVMCQALVADGARLILLEIRQAMRVADEHRNFGVIKLLMERADSILLIMGQGR